MSTTVEDKVTKKRACRTQAPILVEGAASSKKPILKQGSTWAGLFTIAAAIATGGASVLADPAALSQIAAGVGLLFAEN